MTSSLLLWTGPVQASDIRNVVWQSPVDIVVISHGPSGGFGSSSFSELARSYQDAGGHLLPTLLAHAHIHPEEYPQIAVAGFSAAHGLMAPLLGADGDRILAAVCLDACFSDPSRLVKPGYLAYGERAVAGEVLFVMSSSAGGGRGSGATIGPGVPDFSTGFGCVKETFAQATGADPAANARPLPAGLPAMTDAAGGYYRAGNFVVLDYHSQLWHGDHVHKLAKPILETFLAPALAGVPSIAGGPAPGASSSYVPYVAAAGAVGALLWVLYKSRRAT